MSAGLFSGYPGLNYGAGLAPVQGLWGGAPGLDADLFALRSLFAGGEKGGIWLPEYSDVSVGSGVGTVVDQSPNAVNATQGTALNKPTLRLNATTGFLYWEFDGSNDLLSTAAIDMTGTDRVTLWVFARKRSDAAAGILAEFSVSSTAQAGSFAILHSTAAAASYTFRSRGSSGNSINTPTDYAAPHSAVLTLQGEISPANLNARVNGAVPTGFPSATTQGTGNYGNHSMFIGARSGAVSPAAADIYGVIALGRTATATEIATVERFGAQRLGVTLP